MVLIDAALAACDEVFILSWTNPEFAGCSPDVRAGWLHALYPGVRALVVAHGMPSNDALDAVQRHFTGWLCSEKLGTTVDAVFTSEDYGDGLALALTAYFGAPVTHVSVDQARAAVPISGTAIRADPHAQRHFLDPRVYASFVQRVAILGGESSGKTTLARALARQLATVWVPEYGRQLWEQRGGVLGFGDMLQIGQQQCAREQVLAQQAYRWLVCDTSPLVTAFYSEALFGAVDPGLQQLSQRPYAVTLVCAPEFDFVQDGTRQDAAFRQRQHAWYLAELARRGVAYTLLAGSVGERVARAARILADAATIGVCLAAEEIPHA